MITVSRLSKTDNPVEDENEEEIEDDSNINNEDDSDSFYRDLQQAKASKLGASIPEEQLKASAAQAESDFLQAMKKTRSDFEKAKAAMGTDAAVDMLLDRIRQEDENRSNKKKNEEDEIRGAFE
jgi:hypothetical protein